MRSHNKNTKKLFKDLAAKNVKRSARDYFFYFFTLTFAVALFYTFNSIGAQFEALRLPDTLSYLAAAQGAMAAVSVFVCFITAYLVVYANGFMMRRRKREFGIYSILGMDGRDVRRLLTRETSAIGGISLLAGLLLGIGISQGLAMITAKMAGLSLDRFSFVFSPKAMGAAAAFFIIILICVHCFNIRQVRKMDLADMLYSGKKNESVPDSKKGAILMNIVSILLMAGGYFVIFQWSGRFLLKSVWAGGALIAVGTILFFLSAGSVVLKLLKKRKSFYYHKLNLFVVNQFGSRMRSSGITTAIVCILMFFSVSVMGAGMNMGQSVISEKVGLAPYDLSIVYYFGDSSMDGRMSTTAIREELKSKDAWLVGFLENSAEITAYLSSDVTPELFGYDDSIEGINSENNKVYMIGVDEFNKQLLLQGLKPISLREGEYAVLYNTSEVAGTMASYGQNPKPITISGTTLTLKPGGIYEGDYTNNQGSLVNAGTLIIPQALAERLTPALKACNVQFGDQADEAYDAMLTALDQHYGFDYLNKTDIRIQVMSDQLMVTYISLFVGITLLITAGAVMALRQMAEAADNEKRYELLSKLGAGQAVMRKSILDQMLMYFGLPLVLAGIHSAVILTGIHRNITNVSVEDMTGNIVLAAGIGVIMYGIYFIISYGGSQRILNHRKED